MNHRMTQILRTSTKAAGLAALAIVALGPFAAHAENEMNPGAMCVSGSNTNLPDVSGYGDARNPSSSTMSLVCPIVRGAFSTTGSMLAKVFVTDNHYTENVCCSARSKNAGGGSYIVSANDCSTGVASNVALDMVVSGYGGTWDYRYIVCSLPPTYSGNASIIHGFRGTEF